MFGVTDKDIQFGRQASVIFDNYSTGESILINDYSKIFDENGKYRCSVGRLGEGPDEFVSINEIDLMPGTNQLFMEAVPQKYFL